MSPLRVYVYIHAYIYRYFCSTYIHITHIYTQSYICFNQCKIRKFPVFNFVVVFKDMALDALVDLIEKLRGILTSPSQDGRGATWKNVTSKGMGFQHLSTQPYGALMNRRKIVYIDYIGHNMNVNINMSFAVPGEGK